MNRPVKLDYSQPSSSADSQAVQVELDRILSSHIFVSCPRLQEFLRYVVDETLAGRAARIKGLTIAQDVFLRNSLEDPQESTIVRVEAARLRRRLTDFYQTEGQRDSVRIEIPKGTYVPSFGSVSTDNEERNSRSPEELPWNRRFRLRTIGLRATAILIGLFAITTLLWGLPIWHEAPTVHSQRLAGASVAGEFSEPAIAILPFENLTSETKSTSLAEGLTEDIVTDLSKLSGIDVIAMTSIRSYKDKDVSQQQIGKELKVSHVLRGSLRGNQQMLRVTAQLFETRTGKQVWAQRFDRQPKDELALQGELARNIAESISVKLGGEGQERLGGRSQPENAEAYALYKRALDLLHPPSDSNRLMTARRAFNRVIEIAPGFAGGYAGAAHTHAFYAFWGHSQSREEDIQKTIELAVKANELDASFGLSFSALAFAYLARRDFDKALANSSEAVRVQPNDPYVNAYHGYLLCANGQAKRGIYYGKRALRLDPLFARTPYLNILGVIYFHDGQFQEALNTLLKNVERGGPLNPGVQAYIVATYAMLGRHKEARTALEFLIMNDGGFAWEDWIRRNFKHERDIELVMRPIRGLGVE